MFDFRALLETLPIMGKGMLSIFVVMAVLYAAVEVLTRAFPDDGKK